MAKSKYKLIQSAPSKRDIVSIRNYTVKKHGKDAAKAYNQLLRQAFKDIQDDPFRPGSKERPEIGENVRSYHISLSRERVASSVKMPRHLILYYQFTDDSIAVSRILHDSQDLARHIPEVHLKSARERLEEFKRSQGRGKGQDKEIER